MPLLGLKTPKKLGLQCLIAILATIATTGLRLLLIPWTGTGAPFIFFFTTVLILAFTLGPVPALLAGVLVAPIAGYLFIFHAHYSLQQAVSQSILFLIETAIVCGLSVRLYRARQAESGALEELRKLSTMLKADITARVKIEAELEARELELQEAQRVGHIGNWVRDLNGDVVFWSDELYRMLNLDKKKPPPAFRDLPNIYTQETMEKLSKAIERLMGKGVPYELEQELLTTSGLRRWILSRAEPVRDQSGRIVAFRGISLDISDRKRSELALQAREAELREAQRVAHVGSWSWNSERDQIEWSEEMYRIFGRDPRFPPPSYFKHSESIYTEESLKTLDKAVEKVLKGGAPYEIDLEFIRSNGSTGWISARGEAVRDSTGRIVGIRGTAEDITQLKKLERMREEWTSVIAHDLKQPIAVISMSSDLLIKFHEGKISDTEKKVVDRIGAMASHLSRMVDDLFQVSLLESNRLNIQPQWADIKTASQEEIAHLSHVTSGYRVIFTADEDLSPVYVDLSRFEQILGNLISNAAKYGERGTEIRIHIRQESDRVQISVSNKGPGISPEEIPRLFQRFTRTRTARRSFVQGVGLGLYITKGLVEAHGGKIWVESTPGETTTFYFTLPIQMSVKKNIA